LLTQDDFLNEKNRDNETPICYAIFKGNLEMVRLLLSAGVNINTNPSPLYFACLRGYLNVVQDLIASGADVNLGIHEDWIDETPLKIAMDSKHDAIVTLLLNNGAIN